MCYKCFPYLTVASRALWIAARSEMDAKTLSSLALFILWNGESFGGGQEGKEYDEGMKNLESSP